MRRKPDLSFLDETPVRDWGGTSCDDGVTAWRPAGEMLLSHAERVSRDLEGMVRQADGRPRKVDMPAAKPKTRAVRCVETGEVFASAEAAARRVRRGPNAIRAAVTRNDSCAGYHWHYDDQPAKANKVRRSPAEWRNRPVMNDQGDWFPSTTMASRAMGLSDKAVQTSIYKRYACAGRYWRYATPADTAVEMARRETKPQKVA